ncbi:MAG: hypothetical protein ACOYMA_03620 [Bacteroidia bacterium]
MKNLTVDYGVNVLGFNQGLADSTITADSANLNYYVSNNIGLQETLDNMVNDWMASNNAKNVMHSLLDSVMNYDDSINITNLITTIKNIERDNISTNASLTSSEKESLYKVASVLRHSLYYWNTNPPTTWPDDTPPLFLKKLREWIKEHKEPIKIACADVAVLILSPNIYGVLAGVLTSISVS